MNNYEIKGVLKKIIFFILYVFFNCLITIFFIKNDSFFLIIIYNILFLLLILLFIFWKEKRLFVYKEKDIFKSVILSLVIIYLFTVIFDPFYRDFSKNAITEFRFNSNNFTIDIFYSLIILFIGSITEELIFRGIILERYKSIYQTIINVFVGSILYSLSHFYYLLIMDNLHFDVLKFFDLFLLGLVLSIIAIRYGLLYAIIAHVFYNLLVFLAEYNIVNLFILDYIENNYYIWYFAIMCFLLFPFILFSPRWCKRYLVPKQ